MTEALRTLSAGLFTPLVGEACQLGSPGAASVPVTLEQCVEHPRATMPGSPRTAFGLVFSCPEEAVGAFKGGDCVLSHPALGEIGPFYVERMLSAGYPPGKAMLQAVFT